MSGTYSNLISSVEQSNGIPPGLLYSVIGTESSFDPNAYNQLSGAEGIAQIEPATAANPGYGLSSVNPFDPQASISFAGQYLAALKQSLGSWSSAVRAYGTVPSSGPVTVGQRNVAQAAASADNGSSIWSDIWNFNPEKLGEQAAGATVGKVESGIGNFMFRGIVAVLAMIFISMGLATIAFGSIAHGASKIIEKLPVPVE